MGKSEKWREAIGEFWLSCPCILEGFVYDRDRNFYKRGAYMQSNISCTSGIHSGNLLVFADGRNIKTKQVFDERVRGELTTYNEQENRFENAEIINWTYNGQMESIDECIYIETEGPDCGRGRFGVAVTKNCELLAERGWIQADQLTGHDKLLSKYKSVINGSVADFLWGTLIGNSGLKRMDGSHTRVYLTFRDTGNPNYALWKAEKLRAAFCFTSSGIGQYASNASCELSLIKDSLNNHDPMAMLDGNYSDLGMAIWYMDNGYLDTNGRQRVTISLKRFKDDVEKLDKIKDLLSINGVPCSSVVYKYGQIIYTKDALKNLFSKICKYVPDCMQMKLTEEYKGRYEDFELSFETKWKKYYVPVLLIRQISKRQFASGGRYMISNTNGTCMIGSAENGVVVRCDKTISDELANPERWKRFESFGVSGDAKLLYAIDDVDGNRVNHKGGSAKKLYERFHNETSDALTTRLDRSNIVFTIPFVNQDGFVEHQAITNVIRVPSQPCFELTTKSGLKIVASCRQRFMVDLNSYKKLEDIVIGDTIYIHNNTAFVNDQTDRKTYSETTVKYHPYGIPKILEDKYTYYRVKVSHIVYEAHMNGMTFDEYVALLNSGDEEKIDGLWFVDRSVYDIHHKDVNPENNSLENLELLTKSDRGKLHAETRKKNLSFVPVSDTVIAIDDIGSSDVYVLECGASNNFVASKFVIDSPVEES